ncbi:MAG: hypothetical protein A3K06_02210 [Candidatus Doudnabacteria bacterium RIFCSPHIGHO2_01_52_17]|uniref:Peptidase S11 D-alanyl-D-alanine carboxypeptidase A N-terminal domain-containing protein n=1 Tax=Candidatus Doudnabacteria bacterium RIFCSPHIGHO2_01_52_17 TaxID=1817820 RepID=A0A1F5NA51_9BACT|nr:MAG: Serine-type D-Ala-D-Ala carboxypeptidase [Parcubacteria group bacterium GW2011_GWA2_52_8]OGE74536.1 MAG: hypothetical protein A3K06_02210 [Candidatus Doudnabacteria bacterium RIFCSPHIGHO2_01_52_17]
METKKILLVVLAAGVAGILGFLGPDKPKGRVGGATIASSFTQQLPIAPDRVVPKAPTPLADELDVSIAGLSARAILVKDPVSGYVLFEKGVQTQLPIASLTKLMTAMVVNRRISSDEIVQVEAEDVQTPTYRADLVPGEQIRVGDLLKAMLISSANDAALALARHGGGSVEAFVAEMNQEAARLGMGDTNFQNPVGFDHPAHFSTAADMSLLVSEFLRYPELVNIVGTKQDVVYSVDARRAHELVTTNQLMMLYDEVVGLKTGYTAEAKGNLIILVDQPSRSGLEYFSIILGSDNREAETEAIMNWARKSFQWTP